MKIALLCPTRERVSSQKRLIESLKVTTSDFQNICLYFGVDEDDPFLNETLKFENEWIKIIKIKNNNKFLGLGKIWNMMVKEVKDDIFVMTGDDMVFETKNWDLEVLKEFDSVKDRILMMHCNDGMRTQRSVCVVPIIHRIYYDTFGYYVREEWKHGYHDTWIHEVYDLVGRRKYYPSIMIRHLHYSIVNRSQPDRVTQQLDTAFREVSAKVLFRSLIEERKKEAIRLKELMGIK